MKPSAQLVTMTRYWGVAQRLRAVTDHAPATTRVRVQTPGHFGDVPPLLGSDVDRLALDGHGWINGENAYFGTETDLHVNPRALRGEQDQGITAPIVIFGFCCGATEPFLDAVAGAIDRPEVAFAGCEGTAKRDEP